MFFFGQNMTLIQFTCKCKYYYTCMLFAINSLDWSFFMSVFLCSLFKMCLSTRYTKLFTIEENLQVSTKSLYKGLGLPIPDGDQSVCPSVIPCLEHIFYPIRPIQNVALLGPLVKIKVEPTTRSLGKANIRVGNLLVQMMSSQNFLSPWLVP